MRKFLFFFLLICSTAYAEDFVCPDASYLQSIDPSKQSGCSQVPDASIGGQRDLVRTIPRKYLKVVSNLLQEMSSSEKSAVDAAQTSADTAAVRQGAKDLLTGFSVTPLEQRAVADTINDRSNTLAGGINSVAACIVNNSTLAAVKTCVSALNPMNASVTLSQVKTTIQNKIDSGSVDS